MKILGQTVPASNQIQAFRYFVSGQNTIASTRDSSFHTGWGNPMISLNQG